MPFANLKDFHLYYESTGAGEPLILISGFASGAWNWFKQIEDLAKYFRVITFDPRGVARSEISEDLAFTISICAIADDVANLLDELEIEKANVLGVSFGGFVAQKFALNYPERLNKLILACTSCGGKNHVAPAPEVLAAFAPNKNFNTSERIRKFMRPAFTNEFAAKNAAEVEKVCVLREQNVVPEKVYSQQLYSATIFDTEAKISQIKAETLILTGDSDVVVPLQNSMNLSNLIPNAQLKIIKGGSHMFFIEQAEEFNKIVTDFVNRKS